MSSEGQPRQVEDPGEFNQRRRLQQINDQRTQTSQIYQTLGVQGQPYGDADFFRAVKAYVLDLQWLINSHGGKRYFTQPMGPIEIEPPEEVLELPNWRERAKRFASTQSKRLVGSVDTSPKRVAIHGLVSSPDHPTDKASFVDCPPAITVEWTARTKERHEPVTTEHFPVSRTIPSEVSFQAFQLANQFLEDVGLDARIQDEQDEDPEPF